MLRSARLLPATAGLLWLAAVGAPLLFGGFALLATPRTDVTTHNAGQVFATSCLWGLMVATGATLIGWAPGRLLGKSLHHRGYPLLAAAMLGPICLPAYVVFFAWWQSWPADSALFAWAAERGLRVLARHGTLLLGLLCWSWPLVAWCVAGSASLAPRRGDELLILDGASLPRRMLAMLRSDRRGLCVGFLLVFLVTFNNTTCFDLAEIFSFGNELRAVAALGGSVSDVLISGLPAIFIAVGGAAVVWGSLSGRPARTPGSVSPSGRLSVVAAAAIWLFTVACPLTLVTVNLAQRGGIGGHLRQFLDLYGMSTVVTYSMAATAAAISAVLAIGLARAWHDTDRSVRAAGHVIALSWLLAAAVPGTIVGVALEAAYNRGVLQNLVYSTPAILVMGYLARFGFVAVLMGRWIASRESRGLADLRRIDGAETVLGWFQASRPRIVAGATAAAAVVFVLCLGEIPVVSQVHPPGQGPLSMAVLNAMHYQRPETVVIASLLTAAVAALVALFVAIVWLPGQVTRRLLQSPARIARGLLIGVFVGALAATAGCAPTDPENQKPLRPRITFGIAGTGMGQFNYPRGIAVDRERRLIYIVDKTARIQRFGFDGVPQTQWRMPEWESGKPTGLNVAPDGRVFVADTHYFRVIAFDQEGKELLRFGSYGQEDGQFIYPTDIEFAPDGRLYVSEYGGNDRVQVFTAEGEFLFTFGSHGDGPDQFDRPQSMMFNEDHTELFIADACNHRIVVVDPQGNLLRILGGTGRGAGELAYPYDLVLLEDGSILASEYGNHRIQRLASSDGRCLGLFGRLGRAEGELQYPWGVDRCGETVFVLDSGNSRVQVIRSP